MNEVDGFAGIDTPVIRYDINSLSECSESPDNNPFIESVKFEQRIALKRFKKGEVMDNEDMSLTINESKELTDKNEELKAKGLEIGKRTVKQKASFVLFYTNPILNYKSLSGISFQILFFICDKRLNLGNDHIVLSVTECCNEFGVTRQTASKGLVELIRNKIIYPRMDNVWWINPNYLFAGNRLKIMTK